MEEKKSWNERTEKKGGRREKGEGRLAECVRGLRRAAVLLVKGVDELSYPIRLRVSVNKSIKHCL